MDNRTKQVQSGTNNVQINGGVNNYNSFATQEERDYGIISEIFDYVDTHCLTKEELENLPVSKGFTSLRIKVGINFSSEQLNRISQMIWNQLERKALVEKFVKDTYEKENRKVLALVEHLQALFCKVKEVADPNEAFGDPKFIDHMAKQLGDPSRSDNPEYLSNAKAIVLYFFEMCDIGKKSESTSTN